VRKNKKAPKDIKLDRHGSQEAWIDYENHDIMVDMGFLNITPKQARKLGKWLIKAADYLSKRRI
jgi:hypothetical protein